MISCILLSAGHSSRFGSPKALAKINERTVIDHLLSNLIATKLGEIIVVVGAQAEEIKSHILNHKMVKVVYNKDYNLGQTSSFKAGVGSVSQQSSGIMLLPVDFPLIRRETFDKIIDQFFAKHPTILIPTFQNKKGHPPVFNISLKKPFLEMDNSAGINSFEHQLGSGVEFFPVEDPAVVATFNTPEELARLKAELAI